MDKRQERLNALEHHIKRLTIILKRMGAESERLTRWRLFAFLGAGLAGLAGLAIGPQTDLGNWLGLLAFIIAMLPFMGLVFVHRRVDDEIKRFQIWRQIKQTHIARMRLDWAKLPASNATPPAEHPFAIDLDITGEYSIHRLLDTSISKGGSQRLSNWLLATYPPPIDTITQRQTLIGELRDAPQFRDRLTLNGALTARQSDKKWDSENLLRWLQSDAGTQGVSQPVLLILFGLAGTTAVLFLLFVAGVLPPLWIGTFIVYLIISVLQWRNLGDLFSEALSLQSQTHRLSAIFGYMENYHYHNTPSLRTLCQPFVEGDKRPSRQLRRISRITAAVSLQRNPFAWMFANMTMPWDIFFATMLARSKGDLAQTLPRWLDIWYEVEALSSLATFAVLNPSYNFPQVQTDALFSIEGAGHPLIPANEKVTNDFAIDELGRTIIITGSNMAGKSSFLRTLGVNLRLAYCGSVVDATMMQTGPFRVFSSIRVSDSVVDGFSYFYAEVRRLKALLAALRDDDPVPLFYLIDEIFRGTNNRERLIGSRSYIQALVGGHGCGIISTHDLELVKLADMNPQIQNYHFREEVIDGKMAFDYRLRPGPCPTTNALTIMRMEGLPVELADIEEVER